MSDIRRHVLALTAALAALLALGCGTPTGQRSLVEYDRVGGFVGFDDHQVVEADGRVRLRSRIATLHGRLDRATRRRLTAALQRAHFSQLRRRYNADSSVRDAISYRVTYRGRTVDAAETAIPDQLGPTLVLLDGIIAKLQRTRGKS